jgi:glycosyltransferase involved in cell wall biosynthesis
MIGPTQDEFRSAEGSPPGRPRIAFVFNHSYFLGGGEISFTALAEGLEKTAYAPLIVVPGKGGIQEHFLARGYPVAETTFPPLKRLFPAGPLAAAFRLASRMKRGQVNIIHANGSRACLYSALAGRRLGLPVIWHVRETIRDYLLYDAFLVLLSKVVVCASRSILEKRFLSLHPWIRNKAVVIHNGVETAAFRRDGEGRARRRGELGVRDDEILFGILGNLIPLKGQDFFLRGLAEALKRRPGLPAKALLMGRALDNAYADRLRRLVRHLGLGKRVLFEDYHQRVLDTLSALDVFVLPSQREGFSRSLLEAMSVGLPVVASRLSEIEEAVPEGENALLVDFGNSGEMAAQLVAMSEADTLRKTMGERNRIRAEECFDLHRHVLAVQTLYRSLAPHRP